MYKILALADFSAASEHAIVFAQILLANTVTEFHLVHIAPSQSNVRNDGVFSQAEPPQAIAKSLQALKLTLLQQNKRSLHTYHTRIVSGTVERVIEDILIQEHVDLVVIGPTDSGRHGFFGNLATEMIRHAKTNVLIVPHLATIQPLREILLATDYVSIKTTQSFTFLNELASQKSVQLTLLTIVNPQKNTTQPSEGSRNYVKLALNKAETKVYTIYDSEPKHGLITFLDSHQVDLLVMIPHHKSFFDLLTNNSLSRSMVSSLQVPLLTLYGPNTP